jgi:hypothetical protein
VLARVAGHVQSGVNDYSIAKKGQVLVTSLQEYTVACSRLGRLHWQTLADIPPCRLATAQANINVGQNLKVAVECGRCEPPDDKPKTTSNTVQRRIGR